MSIEREKLASLFSNGKKIEIHFTQIRLSIYQTNYSIKMNEKQMNECELMAEEDKHQFYFKKNVSLQEYTMYLYVCNLNTDHVINIPKIYSYDEKNQILQTQRIPNESIAFNYGENRQNVQNIYSMK